MGKSRQTWTWAWFEHQCHKSVYTEKIIKLYSLSLCIEMEEARGEEGLTLLHKDILKIGTREEWIRDSNQDDAKGDDIFINHSMMFN